MTPAASSVLAAGVRTLAPRRRRINGGPDGCKRTSTVGQMSIQALAWAMRQTTGSPTRKAVLVALADRHNSDTGKCFPHVARICKDTELADRTVRKALVDLEAGGYITRAQRVRPDGGHAGYDYTLHLAPHASPPAADATGGAAPGAGQEPEVDLEPGTELATASSVRQLAADAKGPPLRKVNGRNLPFDALVAVCNIDVRNPDQVGVLTKAIKDIRAYFWEEVREVALDATPEEYEAALARAVVARANEYQARFDGIDVTPRGLSKWWHQMARPGTARHRMTEMDWARLRADTGPGPMEAFQQRHLRRENGSG